MSISNVVKWVVEKDTLFEGKSDEIVAAISNLGMDCEVLSYIPFDDINELPYCENEGNCVIFHGSIGLAKKIKAHMSSTRHWVPGLFYTEKNFNCSTYYAHFGKWHINADGLFIPYAEFKRRFFTLLNENFGGIKSIFARPDDGAKLFTGQIFTVDHFDKDLEVINLYNKILPDSLILMAPPTRIDDEYRFFVSHNEIISGSQYIKNERMHENRIKENHPAWIYAKKVLSEIKWYPESMWVLDVCRSFGSFYVLEIGCFNFAGIYDNDIPAIIEAASHEAYNEWCLYHGKVS